MKFRMSREPITLEDLVCGSVTREPTDREAEDPDFVIVRSDGQPVFHLVNVIDDLEMGITHVIPGEDHLSKTPKHIALFRAFGVEAPRYGHIPLILNENGSKMSKRDTSASVEFYRESGFAPEAVMNYLCLLGWTPRDESQVFGMDEITQEFDLPQINRSNARFDGDKLKWLNFEHIRRMKDDRFYELAGHALTDAGISVADQPADYLRAALSTVREKVKTFNEIPAFAAFYFSEITEYDSAGAAKSFIPENVEPIENLKTALARLS